MEWAAINTTAKDVWRWMNLEVSKKFQYKGFSIFCINPAHDTMYRRCDTTNIHLGAIYESHLPVLKITRHLRSMQGREIGCFSKTCSGSAQSVSFGAQRPIQHRKILPQAERFSLLPLFPPSLIPWENLDCLFQVVWRLEQLNFSKKHVSVISLNSPPYLIYALAFVAWKQAGKWWLYNTNSNWFDMP